MLIMGLAINGMLARMLEPDEMGAYFLVLSLTSIAALFAQFGLTRAIVRFIAESMGTDQPERARKAIILSLRMVLLGTVVVAVALYFGLGIWLANYVFNSNIIASVIGLTTLLVLVMPCQNFLAECFRGFHDVRLATVLGGLISTLIFAALLAAFWAYKKSVDLDLVITLSIIANGVNLVIASALLWKKLGSHEDISNLRLTDIMMVAWPLWITNLSVFSLNQVDLWIVGMFRSEEETALYGAAARLMTMVLIPLTLMSTVVPSFIAELFIKGQNVKLEKMLRTATTIAFIPSVCVLMVFVFFGEIILSFIYGEYYSNAFIVLVTLSVGRLINVWAGSSSIVLMMTGHQTIVMLVTILCGILAIILAVLLISDFGIQGVAAAYASSMALQSMLLLYATYAKISVWTHVDIKSIPNLGKLFRQP